MVIGLIDILKLAGFDETLPWKLVRHHRPRATRTKSFFARNGLSFTRLSRQTRFSQHRADRVVLWNARNPRVLLWYLQESLAFSRKNRADARHLRLVGRVAQGRQFFYRLERDSRFDDLRHRLIIDWGSATRSWVQKPANKKVLEIQAPGRRLHLFEDSLNSDLTNSQLCDLFKNEEAHPDWQAHLRPLAGCSDLG